MSPQSKEAYSENCRALDSSQNRSGKSALSWGALEVLSHMKVAHHRILCLSRLFSPQTPRGDSKVFLEDMAQVTLTEKSHESGDFGEA